MFSLEKCDDFRYDYIELFVQVIRVTNEKITQTAGLP